MFAEISVWREMPVRPRFTSGRGEKAGLSTTENVDHRRSAVSSNPTPQNRIESAKNHRVFDISPGRSEPELAQGSWQN
jgi:hypothetical protein